jgi:hypothetical protein
MAFSLGHLDVRGQALFHADLQDLDVGPHHGQLAAQVARAAVGRVAHRRHAGTQQRDQVLLHLAGAGRVGLDEVIYRGQRVEQEVRLDLRLHRGHAGFDHLAAQLLGLGRLGGLGGLALGLHAGLVGGLQEAGQQHPQHGQLGQALAVLHLAVRDARADAQGLLDVVAGLGSILAGLLGVLDGLDHRLPGFLDGLAHLP